MSDDARAQPRLALVGAPNVGKSVLFGRLTGKYVTVSNYPGTTVEVFKGKGRIGPHDWNVVDTPGTYSLYPLTEEQRVTRTLLMNERPDVVVHVADAKNLERMLALTVELIEAGLPVILVLNMMDEADALGMRIDTGMLERRLGVPVVPVSATLDRGTGRLRDIIGLYAAQAGAPAAAGDGAGAVAVPSWLTYDEHIERLILLLVESLHGTYRLSKRAIALLLLQGDEEILRTMQAVEGDPGLVVRQLEKAQSALGGRAVYELGIERRKVVTGVLQGVVTAQDSARTTLAHRLSDLTMNPVTGIPFLAAVLYFGLYKFVGVFGAGTVVDFIEQSLFENRLTPWINGWVQANVPWQPVTELLAGEYGVFTLGLRYALAIILPIVGTFFLVFSIIEDSGYLPRLAMLVDRVFKLIGLNGRAVIPMTLGFGCDTMATLVSRTLETKRERIIATLLLALAIPCSAQLGVILALLSGYPSALLAWAVFIGLVFLLVGFLTAKLLPGERPSFYMEIPPLRLPMLRNILAKTYTRMHWYLLEVIPLFALASVLMWLGKMSGLFDAAIQVLRPIVMAIGLPGRTAEVFLFGFFRRDYGAAGLYDLQKAAALSPRQMVVAASTLTLFVPCVAQFIMMAKERGTAVAMAIFAFIFPFAFAGGYVLNLTLGLMGW
ncbi:MAG: ferrous iron transport protein B [Bacillota bacterium]|nr:ferrous iron transport protein B [Bacillota bacterium]